MEDQGKRIVLFVVIAAAIFIGWQALFPPAKKPNKPVAAQGSGSGSSDPAAGGSPTWNAGGSAAPGAGSAAPGAGSAAPGAGSATPTVAPVEAPLPEEQTLELSTPRFRLTFSNLGGTIKRVHRLVDPAKGGLVDDDLFVSPAPAVGLASTAFVNSTYAMSPRLGWTGEKLSETKVRYTANAGGMVVTKEFEVLPDDWMVKVVIDAKVPAAANQQLAISMFGLAPVVDGQKRWPKKPWGKCNVGGSVKSASPAKVASGPVARSGAIRFFGAATPFFMFALSPKPLANEVFQCTTYPLAGTKDGVQVDLVYPVSQLAAGDVLHKELFGYFGPAYHDRYEHANDVAGFKMGLVDTVDFGWFSVIAKPMLWLLRWLYSLVGNWGIAIVLLTVLVKLATLYWTNKSMRSMRAMAALKPEMEALQKKHADDRQKLQEAQMALFKRHGVNPLAGCLPMLLQMPIWMGLYRMLSHAGELHQAVFIPGWLTDLTATDPFYILPVALVGLMFLQSKLQPMTTTDSTQQKIMMYGMPLMFGGMGFYFPAGLTVYITTNTLLGIAHTLYMKRDAANAAPAKPAAAKDEDGKADKPAAGKADKAAADKADKAAADGDDDDRDDDDEDGDDSDSGKRADAKSTSNRPKAGAQRRGQRSKGKRR